MNLLDAALEYAAIGWPVFPLHTPNGTTCSCGVASCGQIGKHPRTEHGLNDATIDPDAIHSWWSRWPDANIGLRTGVAFDALDLDSPEAERALAIAADLAGEDTKTCWAGGPMSATGRGHHILFIPTGSGNAAAIFGIKGVDWRGVGGYIIAPPSLHHSGRRYEWVTPFDYELELAPVFLVAQLLNLPAKVASVRRGTSRGIIAGLIDHVAKQAEGTRNHQLNWAAHTLGIHVYKDDLTEDEGKRGCDELFNVALRIGLADAEAKATIKSGWQAGRSGITKRTAS